jgi:hypothetical protein
MLPMKKQGPPDVPNECAQLYSGILTIGTLIGVSRAGGHLLIALLAALAVEKITRDPVKALVVRFPSLGTVRALFTTRLAALAVGVVLVAIDGGPLWVAGGVAFWLVVEWFSRPSMLRPRAQYVSA